MDPIIVIGSGLAAYNFGKEFRKLDTATPLLFVTADDGCFYSKPMLSNALDKGKTAAELVICDSDKMQQDLNARIMNFTRVEGIDAASHTISTSQGETISYSKLVLALGAKPITPPLDGDGAELIYTVNHLSDYAEFREAVSGKKHIAIIGPGLIGCEFANDMSCAGYQVSVIGPGATPMNTLLPPEVGAKLQQALSSKGVNWHLGCSCKTINRQADGFELVLDNNKSISADVVLSAIGLRPETTLAQEAGLKIDRGIIVDRFLKTSADDVYALGDCAEVDGLVLPYVMPLMQSARALAKTLSGEATEVTYPAMPVGVKTPACPLAVAPPPIGAEGKWQIESDDDSVKAIYIGKDGSTLGFALCGDAVKEKMALTKLLPHMLS